MNTVQYLLYNEQSAPPHPGHLFPSLPAALWGDSPEWRTPASFRCSQLSLDAAFISALFIAYVPVGLFSVEHSSSILSTSAGTLLFPRNLVYLVQSVTVFQFYKS